jgi:hypothetical protein
MMVEFLVPRAVEMTGVSKQMRERFRAKHAPGLDPGVDTGSHSNQVYADCVDLSAVENASKQESRASVLIQSEPKML